MSDPGSSVAFDRAAAFYDESRAISEESMARTAAEVRRWAEERYGPLEALSHDEYQTFWRAYDLSG